ncbi:MAG: phosphoglucosamine mutase [Acidimicrobiales bacterium]
MTLRFGTDGVRGLANAELSPELVLALGRAVAQVLGGPRILIGRDTRRSGPLLGAALSAGILAEGVDVVDLGVVPTPAVAARAADLGVPAAVISASHNPFPDNGIKLFAAGGRKLEEDAEARIEARVHAAEGGTGAPTGAAVGAATTDAGIRAWYRDHLVACLEGRRLDGLAVVLDCAHGAASDVAEDVFHAAGARVVAALAAEPDGTNINQRCGSTDPSLLVAAVREAGADMGLAFDGDADRAIAVDGTGRLVDGDHLLALFALDLRRRRRLAGDTVVVTVMTNLGFHRAMAAEGVSVHTTDVGDRNVLAALEAHGWSLGGEQSGHLVFTDLATTGDGLLSGLLLADLVVRAGRPLLELARGVMESLPQVLRNVPVADRSGLATAPAVWAEVTAVRDELGADGRVLLRPSGTEPLVRVMVEAVTVARAEAAADRLEAVVRRVLPVP